MNAEEIIKAFKCEESIGNIEIRFTNEKIEGQDFLKINVTFPQDLMGNLTYKAYLSTKGGIFFASRTHPIFQGDSSIFNRTWPFLNIEEGIGSYTTFTPTHHGPELFYGTHMLTERVYDKNLRDTIYRVTVPKQGNHFYAGYSFTKKYGFLDFDLFENKALTNKTIRCTCSDRKKIPFS